MWCWRWGGGGARQKRSQASELTLSDTVLSMDTVVAETARPTGREEEPLAGAGPGG